MDNLPRLNNQAVLLLAYNAARRFGGDDGMFNSACFSNSVSDVLGIPLLDGQVVSLILSGRDDIEQVGAAHWRLI